MVVIFDLIFSKIWVRSACITIPDVCRYHMRTTDIFTLFNGLRLHLFSGSLF